MDKQTILGFVLIAVVLMVWMWFQSPPPEASKQIGQADTLARLRPPEVVVKDTMPTERGDSLGRHFATLDAGQEKTLILKTNLYTAEISTRGGLIRKFELQHYKTWNGYPIQMVNYAQGGDLSLLFHSTDGKVINTKALFFDGKFKNWQRVELKDDQSYSLDLVLSLPGNKRVTKTLLFKNGAYTIEARFRFENMQDVISNYEYQVVLENGIPFAEHNSVNEATYALAYAYSGGELTEIDAKSTDQTEKRDFGGATRWVATRNKYFATAIIPQNPGAQGVFMEGKKALQPDHGETKAYSIAVKIPYNGNPVDESKLTVFMGPLDYDVVQSCDETLVDIMSLGAAWIIRPITQYVMIPLFTVLKMFIPNYGVVIILFSIIIKIALHPLSRASMKSMKRMQSLQPMMEEIRTKYKDDPQKMNQHVMSLYKDYGVNPAAGCLPLILQMPILYALYMVFSSSIELRQANFVFWITDLAVPDVLVKLPFAIPLFGMSELSGLALAMGLTMFIQQKMTVTDPRQKMMVWMMPIMMTLLFNSFPAGLNLYYFVFNLLSIGQQIIINKQHGQEPLRKIDPKKRKPGLLERLTRDMPKTK